MRKLLPNNRQQTPPPTPEELAAIDAIPEEAIDYSDIPELDEEFFKQAIPLRSEPKKLISLRIEPEVIEWYRSQGKRYQTLMGEVLKKYAAAQTRKAAKKSA